MNKLILVTRFESRKYELFSRNLVSEMQWVKIN